MSFLIGARDEFSERMRNNPWPKPDPIALLGERMAFRTLIFDFDGTLADTLEEARRIFNELAPDYGLRSVEVEDLEELRHLTLNRVLRRLEIPRHRVPGLLARGTVLMRGNIGKLPLIDGMTEILPKLHDGGRTFGVLTSNSATNVDLFLHAHGLRQLFAFISSSSKLQGKARHLRALQKSYSLNVEETLYIGDETRDVRAAKKAGMPVAAVTWGFNSKEVLAREEPDFLVSSPDELVDLVVGNKNA